MSTVRTWLTTQFTLISFWLTSLSWSTYFAATAFIGVEVMVGLLAFTAMLPSIPFIVAALALGGWVWRRLRRKAVESESTD